MFILGNVVVYGSSLSAYTCLQYLMEEVGLSGERISLVLPHPLLCFNNPEVEKQVQQTVTSAGERFFSRLQCINYTCMHVCIYFEGVRVFEGYQVSCYNPEGSCVGELHSVQLVSSDTSASGTCITLKCKVT